MKEQIKNLRDGISKLSAVKELVQMPGWKVITGHFQEVIQAISDQLDIEENYEKIKRLQERKRAFKSMLETVAALCEEHSEALIRLDIMESEQQEQDQFNS